MLTSTPAMPVKTFTVTKDDLLKCGPTRKQKYVSNSQTPHLTQSRFPSDLFPAEQELQKQQPNGIQKALRGSDQS